MKSMTGFGRSDYRDDDVDISVEIKTVNHRYIDYFIKMPRALNPIEDRIRKTVSETLSRGHVELYIKYEELTAENKKINLNRDLAADYIRILNEIRDMDPLISDVVGVDVIARFPDVVEVEETAGDDDARWKKLEPVLQEALNQVADSRGRDGDAMQADIAGRCDTIQNLVSKIEELAPKMLETYRTELKEKVEQYLADAGADERLMLTEVAVMADRLDISEELTRITSHTKRLRKMIEITEEPIGRKMDFLVQEMNREINTIGSKSNNVEIGNLVVDVKSEIEKIREQIQNIE